MELRRARGRCAYSCSRPRPRRGGRAGALERVRAVDMRASNTSNVPTTAVKRGCYAFGIAVSSKRPATGDSGRRVGSVCVSHRCQGALPQLAQHLEEQLCQLRFRGRRQRRGFDRGTAKWPCVASKQSRHRLELACSCAGDLYEFRLWAIHNARAGGNAPFQHTERILSGMLDRLLAFRFAHSQHIIHAHIRSGRRFWSLYLTLGLIRQLWHRDGLRSLCSRKSVVWGCCSRRKWWCSHQECWLWWLCAAGTSNGRRIQPGIHTGPQIMHAPEG